MPPIARWYPKKYVDGTYLYVSTVSELSDDVDVLFWYLEAMGVWIDFSPLR